MKYAFTLIAVAGLSFGLAACGQPAQPPALASPIAKAGNVDIAEPRMRIPPLGRDVTAGYLTMSNTADAPVTLVGATSPAAEKLELHAHFEGEGGIKQMREVTNIAIPAKQTILLVPGGLHIMAFGVKPEAVAAGKFPVVLTFSDGATAGFDMPFVSNPVLASQGKKGRDAHGGHKH